MKTLSQTVIVIVSLCLLVSGFAPAQNSYDGETSYGPEINSTGSGVTVVLAQASPGRPTVQVPSSAPAQVPAAPVPPTLPTPVSVDNVSRDIYNLTRSVSFGSRSGGGNMVLVIPSGQTTTQDLITINEDMNVMSRIFVKNLEQERVTTATGSIFAPGRRNAYYGMFLGDSRDQIQSMYLQGFGALFLMKVDFPLTPPPDLQQEEKEAQKAEEGDPVWDQMRQQIYEPEKVDRRRRTDRAESKYEPEKVENLKTTLIKALKHAANIRCLKPDESVILTVVGKGDVTGTTIEGVRVLQGEGQIVVVEKDAYGTKTQKLVQGNSLDALEDVGLSSPAVLVIRTKKSDIDEFSKGDIDYEKFRQRAQLLTYPLLGGADDGFGASYNPYIEMRSTGSSNMR